MSLGNEPVVQLVSIGQAEEVQGLLQQELQLQPPVKVRNVAEDPDVNEFVRSTLVPTLTWTRQNRTALEEEWRAIRRMEMLTHDSSRRYLGRSNAYLPVFLRAVNTQVSQLSRGLFPSDEYMDVVARSENDGERLRAKAIKTYLQWEFERVAKLRANIKPFLRQLVAYGTSPLKYTYRKKTVHEGRRSAMPPMDGMGMGAAAPSSYKFLPCMYEGLQVSTRSLFNTYVYPMTADSMEEVQIVFEDIDTPRSFIEKMGREKRWLNVEQALNAPENPQHLVNRQELLSTGAGSASTVGPAVGTPLDVRTLTEAWVYMQLPKDQYMDGEDTEAPILAKVVLAGEVPVEVIRCPYFHQRPPYLWARMNTGPGLFYGHSVGRAIRAAQYLANDFANQTNDCGTYTLNPIALVNPGQLAGPLPTLAPGKMFQVTDPNAVKFDRPPAELIQYGQQITGWWVNFGQDLSGTPPVLQGSSDADTATATQILQKNATTPLQDVVEDIECDVLEPLMYGAWCNAQQYREDDVMAMVAGEPIRVSLQDLVVDAEFRWLASSQAANQQQRAQQSMQFMQAIVPIVPLLAQQGKQVNFAEILQRVYVDGFGFRNFDQVIMQAPPPMVGPDGQPLPPGMAPPGMPPGQGAPDPSAPGDRVRSALEQVPGAPPIDPVAGEGDAFNSVRSNADDLAGLLGGGGMS